MKTLQQLFDDNKKNNHWDIALVNYCDAQKTFESFSDVLGELLVKKSNMNKAGEDINSLQIAIDEIKKLICSINERYDITENKFKESMNDLINLKDCVISIQGYTEFDILEWSYCDYLREIVVKFKPKDYPVSFWNASMKDIPVR